MQDVLDRFELEYQLYNGLSKERCQTQTRHLRRLTEFAGKETPLDCVANDLRGYAADLATNLHVNSVRTYLNMIKPFYGWAFQSDLYQSDELLRIREVSPPAGATNESTPRPYSPKELLAFWKALDARFPRDERFDYWLPRWRREASRWVRLADHVERVQSEAIFSLALDGGLRRLELFEASIEDIHPDNSVIIVRQRDTSRTSGKNKRREVPYTQEARNRVYEWLELRARLGVGHDRPWVAADKTEAVSRLLGPMSFRAFESLPHRIADFAEYHRFRHTCGTLWLRSGMKLEIVQRTLGHARLQQTLGYAQLVAEDIEQSAARNEEKFAQLTRRDEL
jgi:integrase